MEGREAAIEGAVPPPDAAAEAGLPADAGPSADPAGQGGGPRRPAPNGRQGKIPFELIARIPKRREAEK
jgi:hypothetical protein